VLAEQTWTYLATATLSILSVINTLDVELLAQLSHGLLPHIVIR
jgi:hypothetical protein